MYRSTHFFFRAVDSSTVVLNDSGFGILTEEIK